MSQAILWRFWATPLAPRCELGGIWGSMWMPVGAHLGTKMGQAGAKMTLCWPTWRQDVPKMANLEAKMANLAHFWEHLGDLFWILGAILPKIAKTKKTTILQHF